MSTSTVKDSFTVAKGWRKRGGGRLKPMNTTQTKVRSTEEALKLALEALENLINQHYAETTTNDDLEKADNAITAIKEALMSLCDGAKQSDSVSNEQVEPVAWCVINNGELIEATLYRDYAEEILAGQIEGCGSEIAPLYTHPPVPYVTPSRTAQPKEPEQEPHGLAAYVIGCFSAAQAEGLQEALAETTDERLKDLVERRLMHAFYAAQNTTPPQPQNEVRGNLSRKPLTDEQADSIINGLRTCLHLDSKRVFVKTWLRDWAAHDIKE